MSSLVPVVLCKGTEYTVDGVIYQVNTPAYVSQDVAKRLLDTRRFRRLSDYTTAHSAALPSLPMFEQRLGSPDHVKNSLGTDDLSNKRVLLRRTGALGDSVFVAQVGAFLKERFPSMYLALAVQPHWVPLVSMYAHIDAVLTVNDACQHAVVCAFDYIIEFADTIETPEALKRDYYAAHFVRAGLNEADLTLGIPQAVLRSGDAQSNMRLALAKQLMNKHGLTSGEYVLVVRGTSNVLKTWDEYIFSEVVSGLLNATTSDRAYTHVVSIGTKKDSVRYRRQGFSYVEFDDLPVDIAGELVANAACVIGGDTGFTHFAVSLGVPVVSYWQATSPELTLPHAPCKDKVKAVVAKQPCHPCNVLRPSFCAHFDGQFPTCAHKVPAADVVSAVQAMLSHVTGTLHVHSARRTGMLTTIEARRVFDTGLMRVAIIMDDCDRYTGGGFYMWSLAMLFATRPEILVCVLSKTRKFVYANDEPVPPNVLLIHDATRELLFGVNKLAFDIVIGHPHLSGIDAVTYAQQNPTAKSILTIYETPEYIRKYRAGRDGEEPFWNEYKAALRQASVIFTISREVHTHLKAWLEENGGTHPPIERMYPMVNEVIADTVVKPIVAERIARENKTRSVVLIGRNVRYKGWKDALETFVNKFGTGYFSPSKPCTVYVLGDSMSSLVSNALLLWETYGIHVVCKENVSEAEKWKLLTEAQLVIHPSDFEGFGIPVAEALFAGTPVLCKPLPVFKEAFNDHPYYYTDQESYVHALRTIFSAWDAPEDDPGKSYQLLQDYLMDAVMYCSRRYLRVVRRIKALPLLLNRHFKAAMEEAHSGMVASRFNGEPLRVAMVTPYNNRCGVAETTRALLSDLRCTHKVFAPTDNIEEASTLVRADGANVVRCWKRTFTSCGALVNEITSFGASVVHVQHEFSLYRNSQEFFTFLQRVKMRQAKIVVTLHTIPLERTPFIAALEEIADAIVITKPSNAVNAHVLPLAVERPLITASKAECRALYPQLDPEAYVVGTFGLFQPHKGIRAFLKTFPDVSARVAGKRVQYLVSGFSNLTRDMYYRETLNMMQAYIDAGHVVVLNDYPELDVVQQRIQACDAMVYQHAPTPHVSCSASIRSALAMRKAVVCTDVNMFNEFTTDQVIKVPHVQDSGAMNTALADALVRLADPKARKPYESAARRFSTEYSVKNCAAALLKLYGELLAQKP